MTRYRLFLVFLSVFALSVAAADEPRPAAQNAKRIAVVSMFPDTVLYIDQGFGSHTRNRIEVKKHVPAFDTLLKSALEKKFSEKGGAQVSFVFLPPEIQSEIIRSIEAEGAFDSRENTLRPFLSALREQEKIDALIVAAKDEVPGEDFRGVGIVTKLGLLGITNLTRAFFSTSISIWDVATVQRITYGNARQYQQFPAIYRNWDQDMKNGPSTALEARMDGALSDLAFHVYGAALDDFSSSKITEYFKGSGE